jgi:hypothetical protein
MFQVAAAALEARMLELPVRRCQCSLTRAYASATLECELLWDVCPEATYARNL